MSESEYYTVITATGLRKLATQMAGGDLLELTHFVVGDMARTPDPTATALGHEVFRASVKDVRQDPDNPAWVIVEAFIPAQEGPFWVREAGILDKDGDLIAVANYPDTYKPRLESGVGKDLYFRLILEHSNSNSMTLAIDPSVVLATREHVSDAIQTAIDTHCNDPVAHKLSIST